MCGPDWTNPVSKAVTDPICCQNAVRTSLTAKKRPYPWRDENPGRKVSVEVPVAEPGAYRVYAFLSGKETLVNASHTLQLDVTDVLAEQFCYAKDGPVIQSEIVALKKHRERLFPYCPDIPKKQ